MPKLNIIKIGGAIIEEKRKLVSFLKDFSSLKGPKILVHGGGRDANIWAEKLGIPVKIKNGRRITDAKTLNLIAAIYAGQINKTIVANLQGFGCNALGLSGADADLIKAVKRPIKTINYGFVGDITKINNDLFNLFFKQNIVPVCCAVTHNGKGQLLNTNADTIAAEIGKSLSKEIDIKLSYCFDLPGVMKDVNNSSSLIKRITKKSYQNLLLNNSISAGMIPKLHNAFNALDGGVNEVAIGSIQMINQAIPYTSITLK
ncbi:MAG: acetylglutamate kinase [Flavobacteriaceae bacterium]|mgnify:FL=1|tara:strand:+ start:188 stop:964 length:777 start_codon:yes stop_codon:yes gene_type:complete